MVLLFKTVLRLVYAADASIIAADANRQKSTPKADWNPETIDPNEAPRAVREYLETLDDAAIGAASPVTPKFISHSDPASQWTAHVEDQLILRTQQTT